MNKGYTYIDGKAIISDENGKHTQKEYSDNLDKILVQENVIEEMENKIEELTQESAKYIGIKDKYIPVYLYTILGTVFFVIPFFCWLMTGVNPFTNTIDTILGPFNQSLFYILVCLFAGGPLSVLLTWADYSHYKQMKQKGRGIDSEIEYLKLQLEKEKEKLVILQNEKTINNEIEPLSSKVVDDKQRLEELRDYLMLYYDIGANLDNYYKYYKNGTLDEELKKQYSEMDIEPAKEYIEEKGPVLLNKK